MSWDLKSSIIIINGIYYVSQFTVDMYCFADGRGLFKPPWSVVCHWNHYDEEI